MRDEHLTRTMSNVVPTLLEIIGLIVDHIDDEELTDTVRAKLFATEVYQRHINEDLET